MAKKDELQGRWSVGIKFYWLFRVVAWDWATINVNDKHFNPLIKPFVEKTVVLADYGFRDKDGVPENMKICKKGTWNERMCVETNSAQTCHLHPNASAYVSAMFNVLQNLFHSIYPDADPYKMSIAEFSL